MWILHFLPDSILLFFTNALLILGIALAVAGLFAQRIPVIWKYQLPFKLAGLVLLTAGVYFQGGYSVEMAWRERVEEVQQKLLEAQQQSNQLNDQLEELAKKKTQYIRGRTEYITRYIEKDVAKYDDKFNKDGICAIPQEFVKAHNDAAKKPETK